MNKFERIVYSLQREIQSPEKLRKLISQVRAWEFGTRLLIKTPIGIFATRHLDEEEYNAIKDLLVGVTKERPKFRKEVEKCQ